MAAGAVPTGVLRFISAAHVFIESIPFYLRAPVRKFFLPRRIPSELGLLLPLRLRGQDGAPQLEFRGRCVSLWDHALAQLAAIHSGL